MKNKYFILLFLFCSIQSSYAAKQPSAKSITEKNGTIYLNFEKAVSDSNTKSSEYIVQRAKSRFAKYETIGKTNKLNFTDKTLATSPYNYHYKILDAKGNLIVAMSMETELFGPNFYVYSPDDDKAAVAKEINDIHDAMLKQEFSKNRYAFYFKPGDYTDLDYLKVSYYMHIGGLGETPHDVKINNLITPAPLSANNATCTFWRSAENLSIIGSAALDPWQSFMWAVSQAAPIRRIYSQRNGYYQWWWDGWCSGGFTADCYFEARSGSYSQQQWYTRNSYIGLGSKDYSAGGWNVAYQGVEFGQGVNMTNHSDNWNRGGDIQWNNVSRVETTPIIREKPFLFFGEDGRYKVFRPALRENDSKGVSWTKDDMGAGTVFDLLEDFYIVKPGTTAETMNQQLNAGKHLFITPGIYELSEALHVNRPNTIILGTGYATLVPGINNQTSAIVIDDVEGVTVASLLFDTYYDSQTLMQVGSKNAVKNHSENPTLLADLFFRIGGTKPDNVNVDVALEINSSDVIGDHFWIWRADHGQGVGWFKNTSKNGLIVNGHYVTIYGLFNEHFQEYQTLWNGEKGRMYFYQCETPYDPTNQNDYMSHEGTVKGYAAYKVADHVQWHEASMLGIYDVFINTNGADIAIENSIEVPERTGVKIHHACNVSISVPGLRGIQSVINGLEKSTYNTQIGRRYQIVDFSGTENSLPFNRPSSTSTVKDESLYVFPNPVVDYLNIVSREKNITISVFDINGKRMHNQTGDNPIDMKSYEKGIYLLKINKENGDSKVFKIIKK